MKNVHVQMALRLLAAFGLCGEEASKVLARRGAALRRRRPQLRLAGGASAWGIRVGCAALAARLFFESRAVQRTGAGRFLARAGALVGLPRGLGPSLRFGRMRQRARVRRLLRSAGNAVRTAALRASTPTNLARHVRRAHECSLLRPFPVGHEKRGTLVRVPGGANGRKARPGRGFCGCGRTGVPVARPRTAACRREGGRPQCRQSEGSLIRSPPGAGKVAGGGRAARWSTRRKMSGRRPPFSGDSVGSLRTRLGALQGVPDRRIARSGRARAWPGSISHPHDPERRRLSRARRRRGTAVEAPLTAKRRGCETRDGSGRAVFAAQRLLGPMRRFG